MDKLTQAMLGALERINADSSVRKLYKQHGIEPPTEDRNQKVVSLSRSEKKKYSAMLDDGGFVRYAARKQTEIGQPGTNVIDGRIRVEVNPRLYPALARGRNSIPGEFERIYRTEPIAFKSVNEVTALVCGATYDVNYPDGVDAETRRICERAHRSILYHRAGMQNTLEAMATAFKQGFAPFQVQWIKRDGDWLLDNLTFREQSTVDRWLYDDRMTRLCGADFQVRTGPQSKYTIPKGGTPATERLLVVNINAVGNNVEGVSPLRPIVGLRKLKELLLSISGVSFQKYGVPLAVIVRELANASASALDSVGDAANQSSLRKLVARLQNMRATMAPVLDVPEGVDLQYRTPTNDMPDVRPLLEYIDTMIALCFHNEGALLGTNSFGSYAMASVSDNKLMRASAAYAGRVAQAFTELLHHMIRWNHPNPDAIEVWPHYTFRFAGTQDSSRWVADMAVLAQNRVWEWPDMPRRQAAATMGLPVDAFDEWRGGPIGMPGEDIGIAITDEEGPPQPLAASAGGAMNGAQITSMVEVVQQVAAGTLPASAGVKILVRGFSMPESEAKALIESAKTIDPEKAEQAQGIAGSPNE